MPNSKTPNDIAEVPLTSFAVEAFKSQMAISGEGPYLFPSGHQTTFKTVWRKTLRRAKIPYFRNYDLRSTYATRLSAGGVADEWVTQMLRQTDAQVFKKYSQMKLQMKREALEKLNRRAKWKWHRQQLTICWRLQCAQSECNNPIRAQFVHSRGQNVGIRAEMNPLSSLQSAKKLVDVTGIEPVTPCLQSR